MKTLPIVFHSMTGGIEPMALACADGARSASHIEVRVHAAAAAGPQDVLKADGYVFATRENLAAMSGLLKDFFDRCYYSALDRIHRRAYVSMVCAGSDGQNALQQIDRTATC